MPHALLLSPDDQAVSAISAVLEEMSVTCERPLDGVSAAQKLNSQSFDLVLVDCENLPAAKLVFDVCRRGKKDTNPVPIAIVDGRAGLPTAFRLGAELILTKPVAKDQARNTIRNAVSRVRKEGQANDSVPTLPPAATLHHAVGTVEHAQAFAAAAVSSQLTNFADPAPSHVSAHVSDAASDAAPNAALDAASTMLSAPASATTMHSALDAIDTPSATPEADPESPSSASSSHFMSETSSLSGSSPAPAFPADSKPTLLTNPSDDPVLAELERAELEESLRKESQQKSSEPDNAAPAQPASESFDPIFPSHPRGDRKRRGPLGAILMLALVVGVLCAAWKYQPGFRDFAQPQINHVLALVGIAPRSAPPASMPNPTEPQAVPAPAAQSSTDANQAQSTTPDSAAPAVSGAVTGTTPAQPAAVPPAAVPPATSAATKAPLAAEPEASKPSNSQPSDSRKEVGTSPSNAQLPGEDTAIVLSSKGAENRLSHSVPPKYPVEAGSGQAQATVVLKAVVDESGDVAAVRLVEGNAALATAAINAVKQWHYRPYIRDGKAMPFQTIVIVDFQWP